MAFWYVGSTKYSSVTAWAAGATVAAGVLRRQLATPTVGNERVFAAYGGGTTGGSEPTWVVTFGAKNTDNTVSWIEVTGQPGVNGDLTNCPTWANVKNTTVTQGLVIQDAAADTLFVATTGGLTGNGSEPTWNKTAGATTTDNAATWTSLGAASGFSAWAAPHARAANAFAATWAAAGDTVYVSNNHAATQTTSIVLTSPGTAASPCYLLCVNDTVMPPAAGSLTTGASETSTGSTSITLGAFFYAYGIRFNQGTIGGTLGAASNNNVFFLDTCTFNVAGSNSGSNLQFPGASAGKDSIAELRNCTFLFGNSGQKITPSYGRLEIINGSFATSGTVPTALVGFGSAGASQTVIRDSDLSNITGSLVNVASGVFGDVLFANCKLASGVGITTGSFTSLGGTRVRVHNCDDGTNNRNYRFFEATYAGTIQQETTVIHTGGASDGTTGISWNIAGSANAKFAFPFVSPEIVKWNDTTGTPVTATVEITSSNTLTNGDVWMTIEYEGDSGSPMGSVASSRKTDILAATTNVTTSSATWGGSTTTQQKLQVTFTPQKKGPVKARIYLAKASQTVYADPLLTLA